MKMQEIIAQMLWKGSICSSIFENFPGDYVSGPF